MEAIAEEEDAFAVAASSVEESKEDSSWKVSLWTTIVLNGREEKLGIGKGLQMFRQCCDFGEEN
jgi:hypothetical protein